MGCATSKLQDDESPAIALCRDRCSLLDLALRSRFAFAQSHAAYLVSLNSLALSLPRFFAHEHDLDRFPTGTAPSSKGNLHLHSGSNSGSNSDAESALRHHDDTQPDHDKPGYQEFMNMSYMQNLTTPSVVHTQMPMVPETMYTAEFSADNKNPDQDQNPSYANRNLNDNYSGYTNYDAGGGFQAVSSPPALYGEDSLSSLVVPLSSNEPPPPPPPPAPRNSTWDFLNPFDTIESYYPTNTPRFNPKDIRKAEGIPELEDDENDEVVKEIHGDHRLVGGGRSGIRSKPMAPADVRVARPSARMESKIEYKNEDDARQRLKDRANASGINPRSGFKGELQLVREIQVQFERASDSGSELAKFLEAGSLPYNGKRSHIQGKYLILNT